MTEINPIGRNLNLFNSEHNKTNSEKKSPNESLFLKLDKDGNGVISKEELVNGGYQGKALTAMSEALFFAQRDVNKWFSLDRDKNGTANNIECEMWDLSNNDQKDKTGDLTPEQFAKKYNMVLDKDKSFDNFKEWCSLWIENDNPMSGIKAMMKERYGKEFTDEETKLLYETMKNQVNRWLLKEDFLYNRLNEVAYTRLVTDQQTLSCCGGDISKPPIGEQPELNADGTLADATSCAVIFSDLSEKNSSNTADEMKNRLAWGIFDTVSDIEAAKMSPEEYKSYQNEWNKIRNMKASDYRELLKPENKAALEKFEESSNMTVRQIVDYIDIVEGATGKDFDSNDWSVDYQTFHDEILSRVNGTYGDDKILENKTRKDVLPERQDLLKYLEENDLLLDQFKDI